MKQRFAYLSIVGFLVAVLTNVVSFASEEHVHVIGKGAQELPLFDAHMHYKRDAWAFYPPDVVISLMDKNGVAMALVSSSPDDGTIKLWEYAPDRIVPEMRPYDDRYGPRNWTQREDVGGYIEQRVRQYPHQGIGEFHMHDIDSDNEPLMQRIVALALEKKIPLHVHSDYEPIEYLYGLNPELTIIWAHAGMNEPVAIVENMLDRYPTLYADLSYRETDILTGEVRIDPEWKRLLEKHSDRFMVGSDTWINNQWEYYDELIATNRHWLAHVTPDTARKIAYQNAERLFGVSVKDKLKGGQ